MPKYVVIDENGYVTSGGFNQIVPAGAIVIGNEIDGHRLFVDGENGLVARPQSPAPVEVIGGYSVADCPTGTRIQVVDTIGDEVLLDYTTITALEVVDFDLPDAGEYCVMVTSPLPYLMTSVRLKI